MGVRIERPCKVVGGTGLPATKLGGSVQKSHGSFVDGFDAIFGGEPLPLPCQGDQSQKPKYCHCNIILIAPIVSVSLLLFLILCRSTLFRLSMGTDRALETRSGAYPPCLMKIEVHRNC